MALAEWSLDRLVRWVGVAALMVIFVPTAAYVTYDISSSAEESLAERGQGLAEGAAGQVVDALLIGDRLTLSDILERTAAASKDVRYLCVRDASGAIVCHTFKGAAPSGLRKLWAAKRERISWFRTSDGPMMDISAPILDGQAGTVHVGLSRGRAVEATHRLLWPIALTMIGALGVVLVGAQVVAERVSRPLRQLEAMVSKFPAGAPTPDGVLPSGTREVESLAQSFADMALRLDSLERERSATQERMIHTERLAALGELTAGLAHEIHNPLDGMQECVRYLEADSNKGERATKYLPMIKEGLQRVATVMQRMLNFAHSGHDTSVEECHVSEMVDSLVLMLQSRLELSKVRLSRNSPGACVCLCNRQALSQSVLNLVLNAIEAAEKSPHPEISVEGDCSADWVYLSVEDSGSGVPQELREEIFHPFFTTKAVGKGTGLGLSISRELMRAAGGDLELSETRSRLGGARFVIRLPRATASGSCNGCKE